MRLDSLASNVLPYRMVDQRPNAKAANAAAGGLLAIRHPPNNLKFIACHHFVSRNLSLMPLLAMRSGMP